MKRKTRQPGFRTPQFQNGSPDIAVAPLIEERIRIDIDTSDSGREQDDRFLRLVLAAGVVVIGIIVATPALMQWPVFMNPDSPARPGRWIWLLAFAGGLHVLYSAFIATVDDFGAYRSLAVFFLVSACLMGFFGIALWLGNNSGMVPQFLQISVSHQLRGAAWCGAMAGLSVLASYVFSREAIFARDRQGARRGKESRVD